MSRITALHRALASFLLTTIGGSPAFGMTPAQENVGEDSAKEASHVRFYDERDGGGKMICEVTFNEKSFLRSSNFKKQCQTDSLASSMVLQNVRLPTGIAVIACDHHDNVARIKVKSQVDSITIGTFEQNKDEEAFSQTYTGRGGLDGKVSCFVIDARHPK